MTVGGIRDIPFQTKEKQKNLASFGSLALILYIYFRRLVNQKFVLSFYR